MKLNRKHIGLFGTIYTLVFLLVFSLGCKKNSNDNVTTFTIKVDSINHPDTIFFDSTMIIQFHGHIGPTDCYSFYKFEPSYVPDSLIITVLGKHEDKQGCAPGNINLEAKTLLISNLPKGTTKVVINQPVSSALIDSVYVR